MFLKLDGYFLEPNTEATIKLFNGTFEKSENVITRDRMLDVSLVGNGKRTRQDTTSWTEDDAITLLHFTTGAPGTWVAGVSTASRDFAQTAEAFTSYLKHDGVLDVLEERERTKTSDQDVVERYSKHVKTIFQVGDKTSSDWRTELEYPIEFIPLGNPYVLNAGDALPVKLLWQGEPLANQIVYAASDHSGQGHSHADGADHNHVEGEDHTHTDGTMLRTDANGNVIVELTNEGTWYLRTIYLVESEEEGLTHESNWATLTFGVAGGHSHADGSLSHADGSTHSHGNGPAHSHGPDDHAHEEGGLPSYLYWLGSLAIIAVLFFWFNRKQDA